MMKFPFYRLNQTIRRHISSQSAAKPYDIIVIGGGIVGCASAREISSRNPNLKIAIVEKENKLGQTIEES